MKKPTQVLFRRDQLKSIVEIERRLAAIEEMQRVLSNEKFDARHISGGMGTASQDDAHIGTFQQKAGE